MVQGTLGKKEHNHFPDIATQKAEEMRANGKQKILEGRGKRVRKIMEEIEDGVELETLQAMGDQEAVMQMLRRLVNI